MQMPLWTLYMITMSKRIVIGNIIILSAILILSGCRTQQRLIGHNTTTRKDSVNTEVRIETAVEYIIDTVYIEIPSQTAVVTIRDSVSHLENDYAISDARINPDGTLYHDLRTIPQKKAVDVNIPIIRKDSIRYEYKSHTEEKDNEIPVEVERGFTWWERTCIKWFPWSLIAIALGVCLKFRHPIIALVKRLILRS